MIDKLRKKCLTCQKDFYFFPYQIKTAKFCSRSCNLKSKRLLPGFEEKRLKNLKKVVVGNKFRLGTPSWNSGLKGFQVAWNKGIPQTDAVKQKLRVSKLGKPSGRKGLPLVSMQGKLHWNWKGGITDNNRKVRQSVKYKNWRMSVFQRDRFSCVLCGYRSSKKRDIRADHIKPFCKYPELRFDINNGRTLCIPCDIKFGWQLFREQNPRSVNINKIV